MAQHADWVYILVGEQHGPISDCVRVSTKMWTLWCVIWLLLLSLLVQTGLGLKASNGKLANSLITA